MGGKSKDEITFHLWAHNVAYDNYPAVQRMLFFCSLTAKGVSNPSTFPKLAFSLNHLSFVKYK